MRFLVVFLCCLAGPAAAEELELVIHLSSESRGATVSAEWIERAVGRANELLAGTEVRVSIVARESNPYPQDVETRQARHALARFAKPGRIHVFIARELANVDKPGLINGVHWRHRGSKHFAGRRYIILGKKARSGVLAHELGHFFGLSHSDLVGNLMSYRRGKGPPTLEPEQIVTMNRRRELALRRGFISAKK